MNKKRKNRCDTCECYESDCDEWDGDWHEEEDIEIEGAPV